MKENSKPATSRGVGKMDPALEKLIRLHDLEKMEEEISSEEYMKIISKLRQEEDEEELKKMRDEALEAIQREKEEIIKELNKINPAYYNRYRMFKNAYGHGIAQVVEGICLNCFSRVPTSFITQHGKLLRCPNCGIFLYVPKGKKTEGERL